MVRLEGVYTIVHADPPVGHGTHDHDHGRYDEWLTADDGRQLRLRFNRRHHLQPNQRVSIVGWITGDTVTVDAVEGQAAPPAAQSVGDLRALVIAVHWSTPGTRTADEIADQIFRVDDAWYREVSYGQTSLSGAVTPWLQIERSDCDNSYYTLASRAIAAAEAAGYATDSYDRLMFYMNASCNYGGLGEVGGRLSWIPAAYMDTRVTVHELGHNHGLWHSNIVTCYDGASLQTAFGGSCSSSEYGDTFDAMGYGFSGQGHFNVVQKDILGWLDGWGDKLWVSSGAHTATLAPVEQPSGLRSLQLSTPTRQYEVEYRQPQGVDSFMSSYRGATGGVLVHLADPYIYGTALLDMTPRSSGWFSDAALPSGARWNDPDNTFTLSVGPVTATGAQVRVTYPATQPPCTIIGTPGADTLTGTASDDVICGYAGDDMIVGGGGNDWIVGGLGIDKAGYGSSPGPVTVALSNGRASGHGKDVLTGIERVDGSPYADRISGTSGTNLLAGGGGNDTVMGYGGDDVLYGGTGSDHLDGGGGTDRCDGGSGKDTSVTCETRVAIP